MTVRSTTVKLAIFATVMTLIFVGLAVVFSQYRFSTSKDYSATFVDVSGLKPGDKVRIAGVPVGAVKNVKIDDDNLADVEFDVESKYSLFEGTKATVRYENLVGDRYMELLEGAGSVEPLPEGGSIPVDQTSPALDLDLLLGGFKPLLRSLNPQQVNDLSAALVQVFQGQGGTLVSLLGSTSSFTNTLADRDQLIGEVITNLNEVLGTINNRGDQFRSTLDQLQQLVSGLAQDRDPIGDAIPRIAGGTGDLAELLEGVRPPLQSTVAEANRTATQLQMGEETLDWVLQNLPDAYRRLIRIGTYGSFFQMYVCTVKFKFTGPEGSDLLLNMPGGQTAGRCAP
ncbi:MULTISPECIES: MCE family protein [Rhodococcus]|uniref:MCE family protein n=1 Tax=Rhodococcus oxybenzonivorans TaxID=1990687 RepID=A0AAE5A6P9_9NOCA|nr:MULTISPECIES: MCE family protein [Rhodococcus]MDV7241038.1 MCE family protein [Rhodococcus oxybenzonivorans]MDV7266225.1 MCE family protein [Rhodococcus oxybenzonivorans]MDV7273311.1 MCE family protein [Rhodococcus oxybenzonivorans]MDV7332951.1 MCE family protein [Rhodococcus oxybenzonivorans]MDV7342117.1 MCE family protein [Rhodococcus oxybenzonivorans]